MTGSREAAARVILDKTAFPPLSGLKEGGFVFVRVLSQLPNGKTLISFAGNRFEVTSLKELSPGMSFRARIEISGNSVLLVPQYKSAEELRRITAQSVLPNGAFFASLGLPAELPVLRLLQFLQQNGLKINTSHVLKARKAALQFEGSEDEAAETALFLLEKGIEPDAETIAVFLQLLQGETGNPGRESGTDSGEGGADSGEDATLLENLYRDERSLLLLPPGLLTMANHLRTGKKHWIVLPFEFSLQTVQANGVIRLLSDTESRKTEKIAVTCFCGSRIFYFFVLPDTSNKSKICVYYMREPYLSADERISHAAFLKELFSEYDCTVQYDESLTERFFFLNSEPLFSVNMEA